MEKDQTPTKEENKEDNQKEVQKEEQTEKEKTEEEPKAENSKKEENGLNEKDIEEKSKLLNKPKELLGFDVVSHFKENMSETEENSLGPITEKSYYCINCKHSQCPIFKEDMNQKEHLLIKRAKCLFYDKNFFDSLENTINEAFNYNQLKNGIKECFANSIDTLKN